MQLAHPGAPVILFPLPVHADPRTAALTTAPLNHRGLFLPGELVHHFGLPAMTGYAGTDDDLPGTWLAAAETAHTVMLAGIVGSELMTTIGLTNRYQLFTPEHMMLDDDLYRRAATPSATSSSTRRRWPWTSSTPSDPAVTSSARRTRAGT